MEPLTSLAVTTAVAFSAPFICPFQHTERQGATGSQLPSPNSRGRSLASTKPSSRSRNLSLPHSRRRPVPPAPSRSTGRRPVHPIPGGQRTLEGTRIREHSPGRLSAAFLVVSSAVSSAFRVITSTMARVRGCEGRPVGAGVGGPLLAVTGICQLATRERLSCDGQNRDGTSLGIFATGMPSCRSASSHSSPPFPGDRPDLE